MILGFSSCTKPHKNVYDKPNIDIEIPTLPWDSIPQIDNEIEIEFNKLEL